MKTKLIPIAKLTRPFLLKFFADPEKKWCCGVLKAGGKRCAFGHLNEAVYVDPGWPVFAEDIVEKAEEAFGMPSDHIVNVNNAKDARFKQRTPRARILAALKAAAKRS